MTPETFWLIVKIVSVVTIILGFGLLVLWRTNSLPDNNDDYGAPSG